MGYGGCSSALAAQQYLAVRLRHYEGLEEVRWHVQTQVTAVGDTGFAAPLIVLDSSADQAGWHYRLDGYGQDGSLVDLPAEGAPTLLSLARESGRAGVLYVVLTDDQRRLLRRSRSYWQRSRQSADGGATWTDWLVEPLEVE